MVTHAPSILSLALKVFEDTRLPLSPGHIGILTDLTRKLTCPMFYWMATVATIHGINQVDCHIENCFPLQENPFFLHPCPCHWSNWCNFLRKHLFLAIQSAKYIYILICHLVKGKKWKKLFWLRYEHYYSQGPFFHSHLTTDCATFIQRQCLLLSILKVVPSILQLKKTQFRERRIEKQHFFSVNNIFLYKGKIFFPIFAPGHTINSSMHSSFLPKQIYCCLVKSSDISSLPQEEELPPHFSLTEILHQVASFPLDFNFPIPLPW